MLATSFAPHVQAGRHATTDRLYGRDEPIAALVQSFGRIVQGEGEVLLLPGKAGVGKTSIVQRIRGSVLAANGFFLEGKFNQYQRHIPYGAIREALTRLAHELTSEHELLRRLWIPRLRAAVGVLGRLVVDFVPEFGPLLGDLPPVEEISPLEARHRFAAVLRGLLAGVARAEHPVVLFLDDWQWADTASLELLKLLKLGTSLRYLLLIAPYRDDEVDDTHPFVATVEELHRQGSPVRSIEVRELSQDDVRAWAEDIFKPEVANLDGLSALIHRQTEGNPFFIQASFDFLQDSEQLYFSSDAGRWEWKDWDSISEYLPDNVVTLYRNRLLRLDRMSRDLFARAACLGNRFDIESLATIGLRPVEECRRILSRQDELVVPLGAADATEPTWFKFVHDRIQQAAHGLIPPRELPAVHLTIGRLLLARFGPDHIDARVFEVAGHLNTGQPLIEDPAEMVRSVELNVAAARRARSSTAWSSALHFHRAAGKFLAVPGFADALWSDHHELAFSFFLEWAESEFLEGDRATSRSLIDQALERAKSPTERAAAFNLLIVQNTLRARYEEAISAGIQALSALEITLPMDDYETARDAEIALVRSNLAGRSVSSLARLPVMSRPEMTLAAKILIAMGPACYRSHQRLWGVIVPKVVNLTLQYGNIPEVSYSHPALAGLLCWVADDFSLAKELSELATHLMTHVFDSPSDRSVYSLMIGSSVRHWFRHLRAGTEDYADANESGLQSGNLQYSSYAFGHNMYCRFYQGAALGDLIRETKGSLAFSESRHNQWAISLVEGGLRIFAHLSGSGGDVAEGASWEASYLRSLDEHRDVQVTCVYKILKTFSLLVMGSFDEASKLSDEVESILYTVGTQGLLPWPEHVFARLLILTALPPSTDPAQREVRRCEIDRIVERLRLWATHCSANFEHKYKLAAAEVARLDERPAEALVLYEQAIAAAREGGFTQWEGIANERAARFWRTVDGELAQTYLQHAYHCFERWGATTKLDAMAAEYVRAVADRLPPPRDPNDPVEARIRGDILKAQARGLNAQSMQAVAIQMSGRLEKQAADLARATESLRAEVAERKLVQEELRLSHEQLEARVLERTAALAESEKRYSRLIDTANEGVWSFDENLRTTFVNARMARLLGYSESEMIGRNVDMFLLDEDLPDHEERVRRWRRGESEIYERRYRLKSGGSIWTITSATPLRGPEGELQGGFAMVSDISGLKRNEAELLEARTAAESAARLRARFLDIAAHELRTPVTAFSLLLELTERQLERHDRPVDISTVRRLRTQADRLSRLVVDLLDVSRLERGALNLQKEPTNMVALISECLEDFRLRAPERRLSFVEPARPIESAIDKTRIHQVLSNLLDNAIKYTSDDTPVDVVVRTADGDRVRVSVSDAGSGIPDALQQDLFNPFARGASEREGRFCGLGLGLYICRSIVELHGGTIGVTSKEGAGSTFAFELPTGLIR